VKTAKVRATWPALAVAFVLVAAAALAFVSGNNTVTAQSTVSFSQDIIPMFVESCTACHGGDEATSGSAGLNLEAPFAYDNLVGVQARPYAEEEFEFFRVTPGKPEVSYLMHKLLGTQDAVGGRGTQMPRGMDPWTEEQLNLVREWILAGAPNN